MYTGWLDPHDDTLHYAYFFNNVITVQFRIYIYIYYFIFIELFYVITSHVDNLYVD